MPLKDIVIRPGVNKELTRYATQLLGVNNASGYLTGWYESNNVRFRQGTAEKIGGWIPIIRETFLGVCRSLWGWVTLAYIKYISVGTNLKFYIQNGGGYYDITPIRAKYTLGSNPFTTISGSAVVTVTDSNGGYNNGDFVTFSGATAVNGITLLGEYELTCSAISPSTYTVTASNQATGSGSGGGSNVVAAYQINTGFADAQAQTGWGASGWGSGNWGQGTTEEEPIRLWTQDNYGQDLVFAPIGGPIYYWYGSNSLTTRAISLGTLPVTTDPSAILNSTTSVTLSTANPAILPGAIVTGTGIPFGTTVSSVSGTSLVLSKAATVTATEALSFGGTDYPLTANWLLISDSSRFLIVFGTNDTATTVYNPMLVRWSDQESVTTWTPSATNQAGSIPLSHGSTIVTAIQARQEVLIWTDSSLYALQYVGTPAVWSPSLVGDNISILSPNSVAYANNVAYWMGEGKFYSYNGTVTTMRCDLRKFIFDNINLTQVNQICCGTNESFNEVWWFYASSNANTNDTYVIYNYLDDIWYYGYMTRTAWLQNGLFQYPIAATVQTSGNNTLVYHENGWDDNETGTALPIDSYITSSEFSIQDGSGASQFMWRVLPDFTFVGSTASNPTVTMSFYPMLNAGSGYFTPQSTGGISTSPIVETNTYPIEQFTGQINTRVRGKNMYFKVDGTQLGLAWQMGIHRLDLKPDGLR